MNPLLSSLPTRVLMLLFYFATTPVRSYCAQWRGARFDQQLLHSQELKQVWLGQQRPECEGQTYSEVNRVSISKLWGARVRRTPCLELSRYFVCIPVHNVSCHQCVQGDVRVSSEAHRIVSG
jgi:hypothetical protein